MSNLDEVLLSIAKDYCFEGSLSNTWEDNKDILDPAKQQIKDLILELIGEDEQTEHRRAERDSKANGAGNLRAELRKKVGEL